MAPFDLRRVLRPATDAHLSSGPVPQGRPPDLLARTAELVDIPSESHHESALADHVESTLRRASPLDVVRMGDNVVARTASGHDRRLVIAGHLDTVPAAGNEAARRVGDTVWGVGSCDMKGGLAVMLELAARPGRTRVDVTYVFYSGEEVARRHNGLLRIAGERPDLLEGDAAVLGEPTGGAIEAGCQGVLKLAVRIGGARAHTARPWMGVNALHRMWPVLQAVASYEGRRPVIDGCAYREALQAVDVAGGVAGNVVPDSATLQLNHRFAPDRSAAQAERALRELLDPLLDGNLGDSLTVSEAQPAAPPALGHPLLAEVAARTGRPPRAKLGWTDVAFFHERGTPAVNLGPGDPELAHTPDEHVRRADLESVYLVLASVVSGEAVTGAAGR